MRDILTLALEALENSVDLVREDAYQAEKLYGNYPTRQGKIEGLKVLADDHEKAITALKTALAEQPAYRAVKTFHEGKPVYVAEQPAQPTVPDALTAADKESPEYTDGWNDCRQAMLAS